MIGRMPWRSWLLTLAILAGLGSVARAAVSDAPDGEKGRILYLRNCAECHGLDARGEGPEGEYLTRTPANLRDEEIVSRYSDAELVAWILDGKSLRLEVRPEALEKHAGETEAIYSFMRELPEIDWEAWLRGESIYLDRCLACHDYYGRPSSMLPEGVTKTPRDLSDPAFQASLDDEDLRRRVRHGSKGMPALVPRITKKQAKALTSYVRVLSPGFVLYDRYCLDCHGARGEGGAGHLADALAPEIAFSAHYFDTKSPDEVKKSIWHMLRDRNPSMPHFRDVLSESEARQIVEYLRSLERKPIP